MRVTDNTMAAWVAAAVVLAGALSSCAPRAVTVASPADLPPAFSATGPSELQTKWWTAFDSPELNALMQRALAKNFSIRVAWDRLDQARATARVNGAALWPSVDGTAEASRTVSRTSAGRAYTTEYGLGVLASYEVDLWGRIRSTVDAAALDAYASEQDVHTAAITVTAAIARAWFQLAERTGQLKLLDEQIATNEKYLEVITLRFRRGQASATDVLQQRQLVEATRGERVLVVAAQKVLQHQLAVLLAEAAGTVKITPPLMLPSPRPLPATGVPAEWLRRRPDVRAAELRVQAADRRVAAAIANQFPRLSLSASASTTSEEIRDLFDNWLAGLAANLTAPLFDAGRRRAEVERTRAVVSERLNTYGQTVLASLAQVEDALVKEARQAEYVASLQQQLELSRQAVDQTLENYTKGTTNFVRYLTTLLSHQRLQRTHLQARRDLVLFRIDLYRALAGGWAQAQPSPATLTGPRRPLMNPAPGEKDPPADSAGPKRP